MIVDVQKNSPAEKAGFLPGDVLISINGEKVIDILDYRFLAAEDSFVAEVKRGEEILHLNVENPMYTDIGLSFAHDLIDQPRHCKNKCVFCFIDQLPKGMRDTVYFKDDDPRMSFLLGNYVTLTNLSDEEMDRLIARCIGEMRVSVHVTDPEIRVRMMKNPAAGRIMEQLKKLAAHHVHLHCQIVLCPGYNDKEVLDQSLEDLFSLSPWVESISVVPVGLTKFREGLQELSPVDEIVANDTISRIEKWQKRAFENTGHHIVYAADEFYLKAQKEIPSIDQYDDFPQIENGVGMLRSFEDEFVSVLHKVPRLWKKRHVSIVTSSAAYDMIVRLSQMLEARCKRLKINVYLVKNEFFGDKITVAGLTVGQDIIKSLKDKELGEALYFSDAMLRHEKDMFLDNMTVEELSARLGVPAYAVACDGVSFAQMLSGKKIRKSFFK